MPLNGSVAQISHSNGSLDLSLSPFPGFQQCYPIRIINSLDGEVYWVLFPNDLKSNHKWNHFSWWHIVGLINLHRKEHHFAFTYSVHEIPSYYHLAYKHLTQMAVYFLPSVSLKLTLAMGARSRGIMEKWWLRQVFFTFFPKSFELPGFNMKYRNN